MPEAPATASFKLPAPEALGIHPATPAPTVLVSADAFDWTSARQQMTSLGVKSFQFDTLPDGSHRFVCNVIGNDGRQQQIEGTGAAEGDAADADADADADDDEEEEEEEEDVDDPGSVALDDKDACRDASEEKVEVAATASGGVARSSARCMSASSAT